MTPDRFRPYLNEKLRLLKEFLAISKSMRAGLEQMDIEEVTRGIARRQELISQIDRMDEEIQKISSPPPFLKTDWPERHREEMLFLYRSIHGVLQQVKEIDEACQDRMTLLRDEIKAELKKAFHGRVAIRGYMGNPAPSPKFLDVRK